MSRSVPGRRPRRRGGVLLAGSVLIATLHGCSLLSFKSPERPLTARDLNARILTREQASQFMAAVERSADEIAASEHDAALLESTLRWQLGAIAATRRAATEMSPTLSLLDTWALALQLQAFVAPGGAGGELFGAHQPLVRAVSDEFAAGMEAIGHQLLTPAEYTRYRSFAADYARDHPLRDLTFGRASVIQLWSAGLKADTRLVDSLGTVPEALADAAQRLEIYGDTVPAQALGGTQLALQRSGYSANDLHAALAQLDARFARLDALAESTPDLVHGAVADVRRSLREVLSQVDASTTAASASLGRERQALFASIRTEREALVAAADVQRRQLAQDAGRIADRAVKSAGEQLRYLITEMLALLIVLTIVVLVLPFAAGYLVGRARQARAPQ